MTFVIAPNASRNQQQRDCADGRARRRVSKREQLLQCELHEHRCSVHQCFLAEAVVDFGAGLRTCSVNTPVHPGGLRSSEALNGLSSHPVHARGGRAHQFRCSGRLEQRDSADSGLSRSGCNGLVQVVDCDTGRLTTPDWKIFHALVEILLNPRVEGTCIAVVRRAPIRPEVERRNRRVQHEHNGQPGGGAWQRVREQ